MQASFSENQLVIWSTGWRLRISQGHFEPVSAQCKTVEFIELEIMKWKLDTHFPLACPELIFF